MPPKRTHDKMSGSETGEESGSSIIPKKPRKTNTKSISDLVDSVKTLIDQNKGTQETLVQVQTQLAEVAESADQIKKSLNDLKEEFTAKLSDHDNRLSFLEGDITSIHQQLNSNSKANDSLYLEVNKLNLILSGIEEIPHETTDDLLECVKDLLQRAVGHPVAVDHAYRIGLGTRRKIKLRMLTLTERNAVFKASKNLPASVFINEDLPPYTRQAHGKLRAKLKEMKTNSPEEVKVDWKKLTIENLTAKFEIVEGVLKKVHKPQTNNVPVPLQLNDGRKTGSELQGSFLGRRM